MSGGAISDHVHRVLSCVSGNNCKDSINLGAPIRASWERSLTHHGIDPSKPAPVQVLTVTELREHTQPIEQFLRIAKAGTRHLHRQVGNLGYSTLLCNASGVTVHCLGDERFDRQWKEAGLFLGAVWSERQEGTCGVGTALVEQIPLTIHKDEHFRVKNTNLTCSCAPIMGPSGKLMGLIDVSSLHSPDPKSSQSIALELAIRAARMIESAYFFSQFQNQWVLSLSVDRELIEVSIPSLIAIDQGGKILAADRGACQTLVGKTSDSCLVGHSIEEFFDLSFEKLVDIFSNASTVLPIRTQPKGRQMFCSLRCPQGITSKAGSLAGGIAPASSRIPRSGEPMTLDYLAGADGELKKNVERIQRVMNKPIPILLSGETGTGKEMFAQAIHNASRRAKKPFVAVNCAAIPESLIESELFGYKDGAFTGARSKGMRGKILQSDTGTLFLDEIGDMPKHLQSRLLRVLAEREVTPLGGETPIPVDLHVICASHRNILEMVASGEFREDLYYRLNGIAFELPPLRNRSDIAQMIHDLLIIEAETMSEKLTIDDSAMQILLEFSWPGNIRQLRNVLRYAMAVCDNRIITCNDLPVDVAGSLKPSRQAMASPIARKSAADPFENVVEAASLLATDENNPGSNAMEQAEYRVILESLQKNKWQVSSAAKDLGISRAGIYRKMRQYGIVPPNKR